MSCIGSENVVCKHNLATKTFYVDLSFLPDGVTISSATATTTAEDLSVDTVEVLQTNLTVDAADGCAGTDLEANRALLLVLSGGVESDDEVFVTVVWEQSDGDTDARDLRLIVG